MNRLSTFALLGAAACCLAWLNPTRDHIAAGNRLFAEGKYDAAVKKYGDVLVDHPDSPLLNFNMGDANYKAGKYAEALGSFSRVQPGPDDPRLEANTAYNMGNVEYRLGATAEASKPQDALKAYALALVAYRRAIGANPHDQDAKFNYEFVEKKIEDLKKKLEQQQKKQQQQQKKPPQQQTQKKQSKPQNQQQAQQSAAKHPQQQQAGQPKSGQKKHEQQAQAQQRKKTAAQQQQAAEAKSGQKRNQMSRQEAIGLIDAARQDEVQPQQFARRAQHGTLTQPAQDW